MDRMKTLKLALAPCLLLIALTTGLPAQEARPPAAIPSARHNLMPVPASLRLLNGRMKVGPSLPPTPELGQDESYPRASCRS